MHEVIYAYIVLPPCKRKREKIPHPLLSLPYSETVQGIWRLSVYLRTILNSFSTTVVYTTQRSIRIQSNQALTHQNILIWETSGSQCGPVRITQYRNSVLKNYSGSINKSTWQNVGHSSWIKTNRNSLDLSRRWSTICTVSVNLFLSRRFVLIVGLWGSSSLLSVCLFVCLFVRLFVCLLAN